jgi:hypothetical protein
MYDPRIFQIATPWSHALWHKFFQDSYSATPFGLLLFPPFRICILSSANACGFCASFTVALQAFFLDT